MGVTNLTVHSYSGLLEIIAPTGRNGVGWMEEYARVEKTAVAVFSWTNLQWTFFSSWQL